MHNTRSGTITYRCYTSSLSAELNKEWRPAKTEDERMAKKTNPGLDTAETKPPKNIAPPSNGPYAQEEKTPQLAQLNRPQCPRCNQPMHAASTTTRKNDGPITYYRCKDNECPETTLFPVPRTEFIKNLERNRAQGIEEMNLAARPGMRGTS